MQLDNLIAQAKLEVRPVVCEPHLWKSDGGRGCPHDRSESCTEMRAGIQQLCPDCNPWRPA